jgi:formate-dependent nitrite reductase membrane component NrfD
MSRVPAAQMTCIGFVLASLISSGAHVSPVVPIVMSVAGIVSGIWALALWQREHERQGETDSREKS